MDQQISIKDKLLKYSQELDGIRILEDLSEEEIVRRASIFLRKYFYVELEVWSIDYKRRIDMIIVHKSDLNKTYPIGIEFKAKGKKKGHELGLWLKQAIEYSSKEFIGYGKILVITYPQVTGFYLNEGLSMNQHPIFEPHNNVSTFLGSLKIGELMKCERGERNYSIVFNSKFIWQSFNDNFRYETIEKLWKNI